MVTSRLIFISLLITLNVITGTVLEDETALIGSLDSEPDKILSRHRRFFIPATTGWSFVSAFSLLVPLQDVGSTLTMVIPFAYSFDTGTVTGRKRSLHNSEDERKTTFAKIESYVDRFGGGMPGHECILRTICEAAQTPYHTDGLLGELINALLVPAHILHSLPGHLGESDYVLAQKSGETGDCSRYYGTCKMSLFKVEEDEPFFEDYYQTSFGNFKNFNKTFFYPVP